MVAPLLPDTAEGPTKVRRKRSLKDWTRASSASKRSSSRNVALSPACSGGMHSKGDATSLLVKLWWIRAMAVSWKSSHSGLSTLPRSPLICKQKWIASRSCARPCTGSLCEELARALAKRLADGVLNRSREACQKVLEDALFSLSRAAAPSLCASSKLIVA